MLEGRNSGLVDMIQQMVGKFAIPKESMLVFSPQMNEHDIQLREFLSSNLVNKRT